MFITFEGPDGSGKSTQAKLLSDHLERKGTSVLLTREPGGTELGRTIRQILLNPESEISPMAEVLLYACDRAEHVNSVIKPALLEGKTVICDRYFDSNVAYQGGLLVDFDKILEINKHATLGIIPDLTVLLDIDPKLGISRAVKNFHENNEEVKTNYELVKSFGDRIERRDLEFHQRVRTNYISLAKTYTDRFRVIEVGEKDVQTIHNEILRKLELEFID